MKMVSNTQKDLKKIDSGSQVSLLRIGYSGATSESDPCFEHDLSRWLPHHVIDNTLIS